MNGNNDSDGIVDAANGPGSGRTGIRLFRNTTLELVEAPFMCPAMPACLTEVNDW